MDPAEDMIDPYTGILLTPSYHGEQCLGDGEHDGLDVAAMNVITSDLLPGLENLL